MAQKKSYNRQHNRQVQNVKKVEKAAKKHPVLAAVIIILLVIIIAAFLILYFFTDIFKKQPQNPENPGISAGQLSDISSSNVSIHFLELGNKYNGDSVLIKCGNTEVLIDAGSRQDSAPTLKSYIDQYCTDNVLEYVIATHSDRDHIAGFVGNASGSTRTGILYQCQISTIITFDKVSEDTTLYNNFKTAVDYCKTEKGTSVFTASQCYDQSIEGAKRQIYLDEAQTVSLNILYNYYYYNVDTSDNNNHSVVTLLTEETASGKHNYLFTGDLEKDGESRMVDYYSNSANSKSAYDVLPEVDLFKAGHHGSGTSSTEKLLNVIKPKAVAICCCCGAPEYTTNPANTFPYQVTCNRLVKYTQNIYITSLATGLPEKNSSGNYVSKSYEGCTSMNGTIVFYSTGEEIKLYCSNNTTPLPETDWFKTNRQSA